MALTVGTTVKDGVFGDLRYRIVPITWDSSYPTGGLALTPAQVGLTTIYGAESVGAGAAATAAVDISYDTTNQKLQAYGADGAAAGIATLKEIANTTNLSTVTTTILFLGK